MDLLRALLVLVVLVPSLSAGEFLFTPRQVINKLELHKVRPPKHQHRRHHRHGQLSRRHVRVDVYTYSDGSFNVYEPFEARVDLRAYKPFSNDYDYRLSGRIGDTMTSGDARPVFMSDPKEGYILNGTDFNARLDRFGNGYLLRGNYRRRIPGQPDRNEFFSFHIRRDFQDRYTVWENGVDVRLEVGRLSAVVEGTYDPANVGAIPIALLGTTAGILSQPKLRQDPTRP